MVEKAIGSGLAVKPGKPWTSEEIERLREMARENASLSEIARALGRSSPSVRAKADAEGIFLKPWRPSPPKRGK